jgi:hypothetical protein
MGCSAALAPGSLPDALSFRPQLLGIDNNEACAIGDVNRDGLPDVIAGRNWYAAPDFQPRPLRVIALHLPDYAQNNGEHIWDVDGDGWPDVVATGYDEPRIRWFQNPGREGLEKGLLWTAHTLADTRITRGEAGYMPDLDGDGVPEYVMNSWDKTTPFSIWRFSLDSTGAPVLLGTTIGPDNGHGVGFGDVNGDGRTDILFDGGWYEQPAAGMWEGNWPLHRSWKLADGSCPMLVVDLNEDGRNDVIWGRGHDYGLYWLEQTAPAGDSTTWVRHLIDSTWSQVHTLTWADLDGDGQGELLTGKRIRAHSGKDPGAADPAFLFRYVWNPSAKTFDRQIIAEGEIGTGLFLRVADLNADEKPDIVVAGKTGTYILWQE